MFTRSTWLHLRIPFSFFLMPVFMFAAASTPDINIGRFLLVFIALHIFLYPASNGYNSYFDKDEKSIGGLKNPPKVNKGLYHMALLLDLFAILIGFFINWEFSLLLFIYGVVSKAYSHPAIRLKKLPYTSWFIAGLFQGAFTFVMAFMGLNGEGLSVFTNVNVIWPALLTSAILWGSYPMTQIYQHEEDVERGDITLSFKLGVKGTFIFTAATFAVAAALFWWYFMKQYNANYEWIFLGSMIPILIYFNSWFLKILKDNTKADYSHTMRLNFISAFFLNAFFIYVLLREQGLLLF